MNLKEIAEYEKQRTASKQTKKAFTAKIGIKYDKYVYWYMKLVKHRSNVSKTGDFIPIQVDKNDGYINQHSSPSALDVEIRTKSGSQVRLHGAFTKDMLEVLLKA